MLNITKFWLQVRNHKNKRKGSRYEGLRRKDLQVKVDYLSQYWL